MSADQIIIMVAQSRQHVYIVMLCLQQCYCLWLIHYQLGRELNYRLVIPAVLVVGWQLGTVLSLQSHLFC